MGNRSSRVNDSFSGLVSLVTYSGGEFYTEDFSSFDRLEFHDSKTLGRQFFGSRQFCFSFRQRE